MGHRRFIWDFHSDNCLTERLDSGLTTVYTNEPAWHGKLVSRISAGSRNLYHFDGSLAARQLSNESQVVTDAYIYAAFGEITSRIGSTDNPYCFSGAVGYYSNDVLPTYARARWYGSLTTRWLSRDSFGFDEKANYYTYVGNNPVGHVDASGLLGFETVTAFGVDALMCFCGSFYWATRWKVGGNERNGLIIQKVCGDAEITPCPGVKQKPKALRPKHIDCRNDNGTDAGNCPNKCYFEVWRVKDGQIFINRPFDNVPEVSSPFDVFAWFGVESPCVVRTHGHWKQTGEAFFVPDHFWKPAQQLLEDLFGIGNDGVIQACSLYSTCATEAAVNVINQLRANATSVITKNVSRTWNCCDCCEVGTAEFVKDGPAVVVGDCAKFIQSAFGLIWQTLSR